MLTTHVSHKVEELWSNLDRPTKLRVIRDIIGTRIAAVQVRSDECTTRFGSLELRTEEFA